MIPVEGETIASIVSVPFDHWMFFCRAFRSSSQVKGTASPLTYNPQHFLDCMEYFRSELVKAQYLFTSLTLSASIGSSTLETILVRSLSNVDLQDPQRKASDGRNQEDLIEIKRFSLLLRETINGPLFFFSCHLET